MNDVEFFRALPIFRSLPDHELRQVQERADRQTFSPGTVIVRQGEPGDAMFVLEQGSVRIPIPGRESNETLVRWLGPGDVFGEMALVTGEHRTADVIADGEVEVRCLVFDRATIDGLLQRKPRVARFLTEIVGKRLLDAGQVRHVGKYRVLHEIGRGGNAIVYEGFHPTLRRSVAMKMLSHELVYEQDFAQRFMDEARTIAELHHDNIVQVYDAEQAYATFFIIMERLDGEELKKRIDRGPLSFAETRRILRQVAAGLAYAHRHGVVHRDIKPTNIFLESTGRAKIMDFGIAGAPLSAAEAQVAGIVGTPGYIAPELMLGLGADERADIYALGVMTYEMLVGQSPFAAKTRQEVLANQLRTSEVLVRAERPDTPDDLAEWIRRATCRERDQRIASCDELFALLGEDEHLADLPTSTAFRLAGQCATEERALVEQILARCRAELAALASVHLDPS